MKNKLWYMALGLLIMLVMNFLAVGLPLNNLSTKEISDSFNVYFVPAGYVFSIWGVIYLTQIWFIYSLFTNKKTATFVNKVWLIYLLSSVANALWLFFWHYQIFIWTVPLMLMLLISLAMIHQIYVQSKLQLASIKIPTGIYLGWVSVATIANITSVLSYYNWDGLGLSPQLWSAILLLIAGVLGVVMLRQHKDYAFALVIIWSVIGVAVKFPTELMIVVAAMMSVAVLVTVMICTLKNLKLTK